MSDSRREIYRQRGEAVAAALGAASLPDARPAVGFNMDYWHAEWDAEAAEETSPEERIEQGWGDTTGHSCRTTACLAGWVCLVVDGEIPLRLSGVRVRATRLLGLSPDEACLLFTPDDEDLPCVGSSRVSAAQAARTLLHFLATRDVDWSIGSPG